MRVLIVANGQLIPGPATAALAGKSDLLIAADGGADHCLALGRTPDILLGDLDSISPAARAVCRARGVTTRRLPVDKDATDLELCLDLALEMGGTELALLGALGGRWDMTLANILLAAADKYRPLRIRLADGDTILEILHPPGPHRLLGHPGQTLSLIPLRGDCSGVVLTGLAYPLAGRTIAAGSSLGVSNRLLGEEGTVSLAGGTLLLLLLGCRATGA
jgi:thiamine pyrophosphokinase